MKFGKLSLISALLVMFLLVGACESGDTVDTSNMPSVEEPAVDETEGILLQVEERARELRGLSATGESVYTFSASEEFEGAVPAVISDLNSAYGKTYSPLNGQIYRLLGVLDVGTDYPTLISNLYSGEIAGLYPDGRVQGSYDPKDEITSPALRTYINRYVNYQQNLAFNLKETPDELMSRYITRTEEDALAFLALLEGDATLTEDQFFTEYGTDYAHLGANPASLSPRVSEIVEQLGSNHPILAPLTFPYDEGAQFVRQVFENAENGYEAVNELYSNPPVSTEQILHPELYPTHTPVKILDPLLPYNSADWSASSENEGYGELFIRSWLTTLGSSKELAETAAEGWGNDNLKLFKLNRVGNIFGLQWTIVWDDPEADATEFTTALNDAIENNIAIERNSCGADSNLSWVTDSGVLVHRTQYRPDLGNVTAIAISHNCEAALELLPADLEIFFQQVEAQIREIRGLDVPEGTSIYNFASSEALTKDRSTRNTSATTTRTAYFEVGEVYKLLGTVPDEVDWVSLFPSLSSTGPDNQYDFGFDFSFSPDRFLFTITYGPELIASDMLAYLHGHEYVHYLQIYLDPPLSLEDSLARAISLTAEESQKQRRQTKQRDFLRRVVAEGDATFTEELFRTKYGSDYPSRSQSRSGGVHPPGPTLSYDHLFYDQFIYPYSGGAEFVRQIYTAGGNDFEAVNELYSSPPVSSEQILHPELYPDHTPIEIPGSLLSIPDDWEPFSVGEYLHRNPNVLATPDLYINGTYGEFFIRSWLETLGADTELGTNAAAGWGNDDLTLLRSGDNDNEFAILWNIVWDDPETDVLEFAEALSDTIARQRRDVNSPTTIVRDPTIESNTCGADSNISWSADTGVLVHRIQDDPTVGAVTRIAIAPSCEAALELLSEGDI